MQLLAISKELEIEPTKASRLLAKLGYGNSFPSELDGDMELHLRTVNDMLNRGFTINDAVGVVKRQIDGLDADDPEEPPLPPIRLSTIPGPKKKRGRPRKVKQPVLSSEQKDLQATLRRLHIREQAIGASMKEQTSPETADTKEGLKQLLLDICLNLVSQKDAGAFEANRERCLSLLRRNNQGLPLTTN